jgi:hypothetical protein
MMTSRGNVWLWIAITVIVLALPLTAAVQAPAGGAQEQAPGQRGGPPGGGAGGGGARGGQPAPPPVNLQVFPKDMTRQQLIPIMQQWNMALGVGCDHCHVPQVGAQPNAQGQIPMNFPLDDKQAKKTARVMVKMMQGINGQLGSELGKPAASVTQVQCGTCHRGSAIPKLQ